MPAYRTVLGWLARHRDFALRYADARAIGDPWTNETLAKAASYGLSVKLSLVHARQKPRQNHPALTQRLDPLIHQPDLLRQDPAQFVARPKRGIIRRHARQHPLDRVQRHARRRRAS